jgi:hypothetical protein
MVIAARKPLDRQYDSLLFTDVFDGVFVPMKHGGNIPHRVLAFDVRVARDRWESARHPLFHFMVNTHHPDILVSGDRDGLQATGEQAASVATRATR